MRRSTRGNYCVTLGERLLPAHRGWQPFTCTCPNQPNRHNCGLPIATSAPGPFLPAGSGVAALAYNVLSVIATALRICHELDSRDIELSPYYLASEIRATYAGMMIAVPAQVWEGYDSLTPAAALNDSPACVYTLEACPPPAALANPPAKRPIPYQDLPPEVIQRIGD